ncbi:MAG TPA: hypothetical protein VFL80_10805, partial [Thermoanaerobaculia bacterium]|nr:hypothetical protein [Thermoanaerobaculia bacterium]
MAVFLLIAAAVTVPVILVLWFLSSSDDNPRHIRVIGSLLSGASMFGLFILAAAVAVGAVAL